MITEIFLFIIFLAFFVFFTTQAYNIIFRGYAPFIATKKKVIKRIVEELDLPDGSVVYELGSGRAGFLRALRKSNPNIRLVGIEYSFLPFFIGQMQNAIMRSGIELKKKNMTNVNLQNADVIYCYLNTRSMKKLEPKFNKECRPGTRIVSYQFPLPNMTSEKILTWENKPDKVYIYTI